MPTLVLGEALVDLVCHRPAASLVDAGAFVAHPGGAAANVAVGAARRGAPVALAGGAGDDAWGRWLHDRLVEEGVDLGAFALVPGSATALAFVTLDAGGEPAYTFHGDELVARVGAVADRLSAAVAGCAALVLSSNTLVGDEERALTLAARDQALALGRPVLFDPNLRLHRWPTAARAAAEARTCVRDALLVKLNAAEARLLSGEEDLDAACAALLAGGARHVVVTLGADGALVRGGGLDRHVPGVAAATVSTVGAGDAFLAVLVAALARTAFYPPALAAALPDAVAAGARATESWGALA